MKLFNKSIDFRNGALLAVGIAVIFSLSSCGGSGTTTETVYDPTQGIITKVKEIEADLFRITDEDIVPTVADSRIIATYLDGVIDTFTLDEARLEDADNPRRSRTRGVLMGGMMGYMMGKSMNTPVSRAAYASDESFKKSQTTNSKLKSSATKRSVTKSKKGFGSSRSSKSYGG